MFFRHNPPRKTSREFTGNRDGVSKDTLCRCQPSDPVCRLHPLSTITIRNRAIGFGEEDHEQYDTAHPTPYGHGAAMMLKHEVIERAGMMPECFFLYYEEIDWSITITNAGYRIWYEPLLTVFHKESRSTGSKQPTTHLLHHTQQTTACETQFPRHRQICLIPLPDSNRCCKRHCQTLYNRS